ncbi:MAG TPA: phage holin family protein [Verrucomicrobiae bacterium]|nr:phage holin family protein [Verrucomicrobiae bacterium]
MQAAPHNANKPGIPSLIGGIFQDAIDLVSKELTAAKLEIREELEKTKSTVLLMAVGGAALMVGILLLCLMLVHLLQNITGFELWICHAIVGAVLALVGIISLYSAKQRAATTSLVPTDSVEGAKEDARWITRRVKYDAR